MGAALKIEQIFTGNALRNFNYLIHTSFDEVIVIDPWDGPKILELLKSVLLINQTNRLRLSIGRILF